MNEYEIKANKVLKENFIQTYFHGGSLRKYEDAGELFESAGNEYKRNQNYKSAVHCYEQSAIYTSKSNNSYKGAQLYMTASNIYQKMNDITNQIRCIKLAIGLFETNGSFPQATKYKYELGEIHEKNLDYTTAIKYYTNALEFAEDYTMTKNCCIKIATISSTHLEKYMIGFEMFSKAGIDSVENRLTRYSSHEYFINAILCLLAFEDDVKAKNLTNEYYNSGYLTAKEQEYLNKIIKSLQDGDKDQFTDTNINFDNTCKLDDFRVKILSHIKKLYFKEDHTMQPDESEGLA